MTQSSRFCAILLMGLALAAGTVTAASTFTFSTLAGTPGTVVNSTDGTGSSAQFDAPRGVAVDSAGNVYVADANNNTIRKVTPAGAVTTFAGTAGTAGFTNGTGAAASFHEPFDLAVDSSGNLYVADSLSAAIRRITPAGVVTTLAGSGVAGTTDGTGTAARFHEPRGVAVDSSGTVYVADYENELIRKITSAGVVTTLAGGADTQGNTDGTGTAARFRGPNDVAVDSAGIVYVADTGNRAIRRITQAGVVTTMSLSGTALSEPRGIAVDAAGVLYVADYGSHSIRTISTSGVVTTLAGVVGTAGAVDGTGIGARFHYPSGVAVSSTGAVYVADMASDTIRSITTSGAVTTLAGQAGRTGVVDGTGATARFEEPFAPAVDVDGTVYVADSAAHVIRKITPAGVVTTYAGSPGSFGSTDGTGSAARFYSPFGVAVDRAGNVYVADSYNSTVRKIGLGGVVTTLAGTALSRGNTDGTGAAALFSQPFGIAVDSGGTVYVSDSAANVVRKITSAGVVTTLAGSGGSPGSTDGTGTAARFAVPYAVAVDTAGTVYVADHGNHTIRAITAAGVVTTLAGSAGSMGSTDGSGAAARFKYPSGIAVDSTGNVFVADTDNQTIRQISPAGEVTTVGGGSGTGSTDGVGTAARFHNPKGIAVDSAGQLYIADRSNRTVRKGSPSSSSAPGAPGSFSATVSGSSVTLSWTAPTSGDVTSYVIEAGSGTGLADLVSFSTGSTATTFSASGVASGTYYVRVRAANAGGSGTASAEVVLTVGSSGCTTPSAPSGLTLTGNAGGVVRLSWTASSGSPTSYVVEAGSATGLSNLANSNLGGTSTTLTATGVGAGMYFVRMRATNACGTSAASNEVIVVVS